MRIATWNVNGLRARLEFFLAWLRDCQPDLVGLQELKLVEAQFPRAAIEAAGYAAVVHGQKAWNGVAVLSRGPAEPIQVGLPGQEEFGSRLLTVRYRDLAFTTVYCPNGKSVGHDDYPRKLAWFDALHQHLDDRHPAGDPHVLCGDFNIVPAPIDSWNEEELRGSIFHTDDERQRLRRLIEAGRVDLFRQLHPDTREFSWWDYRGGAFHRRQGLRIDLLLGTRPVADRLRSITIGRDYRRKRNDRTPSDHAPVVAEMD